MNNIYKGKIILISIGLAMDACAVAICKGLTIKKIKVKTILIISLYFGIFQGIMPILGYMLGYSFESIIKSIDHWLVLILLLIIGINMIKESLSNNEESSNDKIDAKNMLPLALATSIDALAVGITFAFLKVNVIKSSIIIAVITMLLTLLGVIIGNKFGKKYKHKAQFVGGFILIFIGIKIFIEHTIFL